MKKFLTLLLVLASTILLSSTIFAAPPVTTDFSAEVSFSGMGAVEFSVVLKNVADNSAAEKITWDPAGINFGNPGMDNLQWKAANVYAEMTKNITSSQGVVYIYQDNKSTVGNAVYVATAPRVTGGTQSSPEVAYNGLVKGGSNGGQFAYLPVTFKTSTVTVASPDTIMNAPGEYGQRYLTDVSDTGWVKDVYRTVANAEGFSEDVGEYGLYPITGSSSVSTGYMYFSAGFHDVYGGNTFGSNHIIFEVISE